MTDHDSTASGEGGERVGVAEPDERRRTIPFWAETLLLLLIALAMALVVKALFLQAFYIPSGSMNDTLVLNDRILVQKVSYWGNGTPQRGDVVVFSDPGGWLDGDEAGGTGNPVTKTLEAVGLSPTGGHLVKRVIAVGGDRVRCCDAQGRVTVNGVPLEESQYLAPGVAPSLIAFDQLVPKGSVWVMGDNRPQSADSRYHLGDPGGPFVAEDLIVGRVFSVVWPLGHADLIRRPEVFADLPDEARAGVPREPAEPAPTPRASQAADPGSSVGRDD